MSKQFIGCFFKSTPRRALLAATAFIGIAIFSTANAYAACSSPTGQVGEFKYISNDIKFCNGTSWSSVAVLETGTACTVPGQIRYSAPDLQYCRGSSLKWVNMSGDIQASCSGTLAGTFGMDASLPRWCDGTNWRKLGAGPKVIFLTSGSSWTVPADWNSGNNTIECIGAGSGSSSASANSTGGGGGAYARISNLTLVPGASVSYQVGAGGTAGVATTSANDTWFSSTSTVLAKAGTFTGGGDAVASVGDDTFGGGNPASTAGAYGGGGAAGPNGAGGDATNSGGQGDAGIGGAGGTGYVGNNKTGGTGGAGAEWTSNPGGVTAGSGGGGGGVFATSGLNTAGAGGTYGGGAGGVMSPSGFRTGADGGQGLIVITYYP